MKFYLCIDDTDNIDSIGTGTIAEQIKDKILSLGYGPCSLIVRHQLFIHEDIPYTSHNSSMCFYGEAPDDAYGQIISMASEHLNTVAATGSDPGLCILKVTDSMNYSPLIEFGKSAKKIVLTKKDAQNCAKENNLHLSEHGGTGQGIIGALAGIGLQIFGSDGEIKGALKTMAINRIYTVAELLTFPEVQQVIDFNSKECLKSDTQILINSRTKTVLFKNKYVLFVEKNNTHNYHSFKKSDLRQLGGNFYV